jgi:selenocysteine-specific elongation factor
LTLLPEALESLARGGPVRLHHGTAERAARLRVLGPVGPSELAAELRLAEETVLAPGDRFILRRPRPVDTVGGGTVVDAHPPRERRPGAEPFQTEALLPAAALELRLERAASTGAEPAALRRELGWSEEQLRGQLVRRSEAGRAVAAGPRWFHGSAWADLARRAIEVTQTFHAASPLLPGISREALRLAVAPPMPQESWRVLLATLAAEGRLSLEGELVVGPGHRVVLEGADEQLARRIADAFRQAGLEPPEVEDALAGADPARAGPIVEWLIARGELVRIQDRRLFHAEALAALRARLRDHARVSRTIDVATFKRLAGVTRKNAIPLLEQLDAERSTRRVGDGREILI